jgi:AcrR family transcriptional regulator
VIQAAVRAEQAEATRAALTRAATQQFGRTGYYATTLSDVAAAIGVTKGAAYHHFADKKALFAAVFADVQHRLVRTVARHTSGTTASERLHHGCAAYLAHCTPAVVRIVLIDGPSVLGAATWNAAEDRIWLHALCRQIDEARREDLFVAVDTTLAARVISASITELALAGLDHDAPLDDRQAVLAAVLTGLSRPDDSGS